jgi:hypothetical protein
MLMTSNFLCLVYHFLSNSLLFSKMLFWSLIINPPSLLIFCIVLLMTFFVSILRKYLEGFSPSSFHFSFFIWYNGLLYLLVSEFWLFLFLNCSIRLITKLPNSEQSYKGKVKTHNYINRQNQSTTGKLWKP